MSEKYPDGKLNENDNGELLIAIRIENNRVTLDFGKDVQWIAFDKKSCIEFANVLIQKANDINKILQ